MSEENNELVLVHEDYISDKQIDETTLPQEIIDSIGEIDTLIDQYAEMDENAEGFDALEKSIEDKSKLIKADIVSWEINSSTPPAPPTPPTGGEDGKDSKDDPTPPTEGEGADPKKKEDKPKEKAKSPFFWMNMTK
jgi:hypothetical protein